jgi:predicted RNase H-like HicB family nuclease
MSLFDNSRNSVRVTAIWDPEAGVWVATSDDVPGLATEAESLRELEAKLKVMIPELLKENGITNLIDGSGVPFQVHSEKDADYIAPLS